MILEDKKHAFVQLGAFLKQFTQQPYQQNPSVLFNDLFFEPFVSLINQLHESNSWFKREQLEFAFKSWSDALTNDNLTKWLSAYDLTDDKLKTIGLILAGNIPMVGFHDVLSVLMSGNKALIKLSSNDELLIPVLLKYLSTVEPQFKDRYEITKDKLQNFDAVIATGSDNTARYFDYYFGKYPNIIRKNRNSVAVLNGSESKEDLMALGEDIFRYYGLGCRNVSKLFVPKDYNFDNFFEGMFAYKDIIDDDKYANNYDYNKAVFLMSNFNLLDNGFLTIKEDTSYTSPISSVFYEFYTDLNEVEERLKADTDKIQCIVSNNLVTNSLPFGSTQKPELWDYADNVDTMKFLLSL
ncbi:Acyl-CoA reductase (LuxC) [Paenimyroides ummariense]|uniref:Acyl-CoA reductase (LuxC) n=1 Tax=Paenimyroides ummariense TaxID=913024 RepID=A0A1I4W136_9FLAO|nr:acyl-CoA reductase [Paenimyroides ummariense]SFN07308.1 Acyl-CoA reductase (LuxC) [Paenimyroides ummariense]